MDRFYEDPLHSIEDAVTLAPSMLPFPCGFFHFDEKYHKGII